MNRGFALVGLHRPKTALNIGSALRACGCYGAAGLVVSGARFENGGRTDTQKAWRHMPLYRVDDLSHHIPLECRCVAVDLIDGATDLRKYRHPERAFYIFGPEDGTLGDEVLSWCQDVVYVPTRFCMNLAATVNVVLYDRMTKRDR